LWFNLLFGVLFLLFFVVHHALAWCWLRSMTGA
jgi:hypothetical protein